MISEKRWRWDAVMRLLLCVMGVICFGILVSSLIASSKLGLSAAQNRLVMVAMTLFVQGAVLFWVGFFLWEQRLTLKEAFGIGNGNWIKVAGKAAIVALMAIPFAWGLQVLSAVVMKALNMDPRIQVVVQEIGSPSMSALQRVLFGITAIVGAPVAEECVFRGLLYPTVSQAGYPRLALLGTAALFSLVHLNMVTFLPLAFLGVVLALVYEHTDNLLAPIVTHSVFNAVNFLILILSGR